MSYRFEGLKIPNIWRMGILIVVALTLLLSIAMTSLRPLAHAATLSLSLPDEVYTDHNLRVIWSSDVNANTYNLIGSYEPGMSNAFIVAQRIPGNQNSHTQKLDSSIGNRFFQLQAYDSSGNRLATSNVVGLAKYPSGAMIKMTTNPSLTDSYTTYKANACGMAVPSWFQINDDTTRSAQVSANFVFSEFVHNEPSAAVVVDAGMVNHVQNIRNNWGPLSISSGYRTPERNSTISGSAQCSTHMFGIGVDLPVDDAGTFQRLCNVALRENPGYIEPWSLVRNAPHVHADWGPPAEKSCAV